MDIRFAIFLISITSTFSYSEYFISNMKNTIIHGDALELPFISLLFSDGHTFGQQLPLIGEKERKLLYCGDLVPTSAHLPTAWHMGYDNQPLVIMEEKEAILGQAVQEGWTLFFEHDPFCMAATITQGKRGVQILKEITL